MKPSLVFDDLIAAPADDRPQHIQAKAFGLLQLDLRRDRQFLFGDDDVDQHRTVGAEGGLQRFIHLGGFFNAYTFDTAGLGDAGEVGIVELSGNDFPGY